MSEGGRDKWERGQKYRYSTGPLCILCERQVSEESVGGDTSNGILMNR